MRLQIYLIVHQIVRCKASVNAKIGRQSVLEEFIAKCRTSDRYRYLQKQANGRLQNRTDAWPMKTKRLFPGDVGTGKPGKAFLSKVYL